MKQLSFIFKIVMMALTGLAASNAGAAMCYEGMAPAGTIVGTRQATTITLEWTVRDDEISQIQVIDAGRKVQSSLFCTDQQPIVCNLEDDGGSIQVLGDGKQVHLSVRRGALAIEKDDGGQPDLMTARAKRVQEYTLSLVSAKKCRAAFPGSRRITVFPDDPSSAQ
jgi:hypothetical protein